MNAIISARIIKAVSEGMSVAQAYDSVFGEGSYIKLAGQIYDELRAK